MKEKRKRINVTFNQDQVNELTKLSEEYNMSLPSVVRFIIISALKENFKTN